MAGETSRVEKLHRSAEAWCCSHEKREEKRAEGEAREIEKRQRRRAGDCVRSEPSEREKAAETNGRARLGG